MCFCCDTSRTLHGLSQVGDVDGSEPAGEVLSQLCSRSSCYNSTMKVAKSPVYRMLAFGEEFYG